MYHFYIFKSFLLTLEISSLIELEKGYNNLRIKILKEKI